VPGQQTARPVVTRPSIEDSSKDKLTITDARPLVGIECEACFAGCLAVSRLRSMFPMHSCAATTDASIGYVGIQIFSWTSFVSDWIACVSSVFCCKSVLMSSVFRSV
jgi:hypothetical protein